MIECFYNDDPITKSDQVFFGEILSLSNKTKTIYNCLIMLKEYVKSNSSKYFSDKLLAISHQLTTVRYSLLNTILKTKEKDEAMYHNNSIKVMKNIHQYSLIIARYIIETLYNEPYHKLRLLEIEIYEDILFTHYSSDKALIMSVSSSNVKKKQRFNILKFTGVLANNNYSTFSEYFPRFVYREVDRLLLQTILSYIHKDVHNDIDNKPKKEVKSQNVNSNANEKHNEVTFQFIIQNNKYISYIKYSFRLASNLLTQNNMLLFGFYPIDYDKIILFQTIFDNTTLLGFSKQMKKIFLIQSIWLEYLLKYQISFKIDILFKSFKMTPNEFHKNKQRKHE